MVSLASTTRATKAHLRLRLLTRLRAPMLPVNDIGSSTHVVLILHKQDI
jgi:hypothetical protein